MPTAPTIPPMSPDAACYARGTPPRPSPAPPTCSPDSAGSSSPPDFRPYGQARPNPRKSPTTPGPATPTPHNSETREPEQSPEIPAAIGPQRRLQLGGVPPPGHDVRVGVLLVPSGTVQVIDQALSALSARRGDLPDHRTASGNVTGMPSTSPDCRAVQRNAFRRSPGELSGRPPLPRRGVPRGAGSRRRTEEDPRNAARSRSASPPPG